jgi:hypothetical protein
VPCAEGRDPRSSEPNLRKVLGGVIPTYLIAAEERISHAALEPAAGVMLDFAVTRDAVRDTAVSFG